MLSPFAPWEVYCAPFWWKWRWCLSVAFASRWEKTWETKSLTERFCCSPHQSFSMLICTWSIWEPVKMQSLLSQVQGRTWDTAFLTSCLGSCSPAGDPEWSGLPGCLPCFSRPPLDGSTSTFSGSWCPKVLRIKNKIAAFVFLTVVCDLRGLLLGDLSDDGMLLFPLIFIVHLL